MISAGLLQTMRFDTRKEAKPEQDFEIGLKELDQKVVQYDVKVFTVRGRLVLGKGVSKH